MRTSLFPPLLVALALCSPHALALNELDWIQEGRPPPFVKTRSPDCFDTLSCLVIGNTPDPARDEVARLYYNSVFVCVYADHDGLGLGERTTGECHYLAFVPLGSGDPQSGQVLLP